MARRLTLSIVVGAFVGAIAMLFAFYMAGAGHGTYGPALALFPFTMLSTSLTQQTISPVAVVFAFVQFPIYALIAASVRRHRARVLAAIGGVHILAATTAAIILRGSF